MNKPLKITLITIATIIIIVSLTAVAQAKNKNPKIFYVNKKWKKGDSVKWGTTIPPFFIIVTKNTPIEAAHPEGYLSVKKHELVHWEQWQKEGLFIFFFHYLQELIKNGYKNNKYEIEARKLSGENY